MRLHSSLNSSCPLSWSQFCIRGALCSTFQWCFYKMLDKWFQCAFWKLMCKVVTQTAVSSIVYFPELSVNCVTLTTNASAALSLVHPTRSQNGVITHNKPRLGHRCLKAAIQAKCLGLKAVRDMTLIWAVWDWKHHRAQLKDFFLSPIVHIHLFAIYVRNLFLQQTF